MTNYTVYFQQIRQPSGSFTLEGGEILTEIGSTEAETPDEAIRRIAKQYEPKEFVDFFNLMEDETLKFVAVAGSNQSEEKARVSKDGSELEFGKTW